MAELQIYRLVYYSRSHIGAPETLPETIDSILKTSQQHNAASNIIGALMFNAACFGQVLEGPRAALSALFDRIQQDPRHSDVTLLAFDPINPQFPGMVDGFRRQSSWRCSHVCRNRPCQRVRSISGQRRRPARGITGACAVGRGSKPLKRRFFSRETSNEGGTNLSGIRGSAARCDVAL